MNTYATLPKIGNKRKQLFYYTGNKRIGRRNKSRMMERHHIGLGRVCVCAMNAGSFQLMGL